ncbi:nucleoside deaminase [Arthrobacter sp. 2MCAF15]|jgi:tRNA(Arg) A34 adenosine deaminase TadA|uniref:nucleoside deaminase n=1 Tax=Arthrobacter sp. 2MCAF15 TaxID=3232984 RepID=UPI003F8EF50B
MNNPSAWISEKSRLQDETYLHEAVQLAWSARDSGNRPFGTLLVGPSGEVIVGAKNNAVTSGDVTGHSETNALRAVTVNHDPAFLRDCIMYSSAEPCLMCAGAIYLSGIGTVVYALAADELAALCGPASPVRMVPIGLADALAAGDDPPTIRHVDIGSASRDVHQNYWESEAL